MQVKKFRDKGVKAAYVGKDQKDESVKQQALSNTSLPVF